MDTSHRTSEVGKYKNATAEVHNACDEDSVDSQLILTSNFPPVGVNLILCDAVMKSSEMHNNFKTYSIGDQITHYLIDFANINVKLRVNQWECVEGIWGGVRYDACLRGHRLVNNA